MSTTKIEFRDIQKGDVIRAEWTFQDIQLTRVGKADAVRNADWYTKLGAQLTQEYRDAVYYLLNRQVSPLPTEPGTIILAYMPQEKVQLILRPNGIWDYLNGDSFYTAYAVSQRPWKLLKLVDA